MPISNVGAAVAAQQQLKRTGLHHFDGTASETKRHRPEGTRASPIEQFVNRCNDRFAFVSRGETVRLACLCGGIVF